MKAVSESCALHVVSQMKPLLSREINPSKVRCGVKSLASYVHRVCCEVAKAQGVHDAEPFMNPLLDALGLLNEAMSKQPLDRALVAQANKILADLATRSQSN